MGSLVNSLWGVLLPIAQREPKATEPIPENLIPIFQTL